MNRRFRRIGALAAVIGMLGMAAWPTGPHAQDDLRFFTIGTAATGGTYFPIGALIANIISNPPGSRPCDRGGSCGVPGLIAVAQSTQGSVENIARLGPRDLQSALVQSDIATWAYTGTGVYRDQPPRKNLRAIANLYSEDVHIVVRSDSGIETIGGLRGKRVSLGEERSGTRVEAIIILRQHGLRLKDIVPSYEMPGVAADKLASGEIDAFFHVAGSPVAAVADLARRLPIDLLPIDEKVAARIIAKHPFFTTTSTAADVYEGVGPVSTLSVGAIWVVDESIDEDLVYGITKALWHETSRSLLDAGHPKGVQIQLSTAVEGLGIPLHPGSERFYREAGLVN